VEEREGVDIEELIWREILAEVEDGEKIANVGPIQLSAGSWRR